MGETSSIIVVLNRYLRPDWAESLAIDMVMAVSVSAVDGLAARCRNM
ncbi:hypothetical protein [Arthrobacter gyeryongensis]